MNILVMLLHGTPSGHAADLQESSLITSIINSSFTDIVETVSLGDRVKKRNWVAA